MVLPQNIGDVSALEDDLRESGFSPNDYLPVTIQMKLYLHAHHNNPIEAYETVMRSEMQKVLELIKNGPADI